MWHFRFGRCVECRTEQGYAVCCTNELQPQHKHMNNKILLIPKVASARDVLVQGMWVIQSMD